MNVERGESGAIRQFITDASSLREPVEKLISKGVEKYSKLKGLTEEGTLHGEFKGTIRGQGTYDKGSDAAQMSKMLRYGIAQGIQDRALGGVVFDNEKTGKVLLENAKNEKVLKKFFSMSEKKQLKFLQDNGQCREYSVAQYRHSPQYKNMQQALKQYQNTQVKLAGHELMQDPSLESASKFKSTLSHAVVSAAIMDTPRATRGAEVITKNILYEAKQQLQDLKKSIQGAVVENLTEKVASKQDAIETLTEKHLEAYEKSVDKEAYKLGLMVLTNSNRVTDVANKAAENALNQIDKNENSEKKGTIVDNIVIHFPGMEPRDREVIINHMITKLQSLEGKEKEDYQQGLNDIQNILVQEFDAASPMKRGDIKKEVFEHITDAPSDEVQKWYSILSGMIGERVQLEKVVSSAPILSTTRFSLKERAERLIEQKKTAQDWQHSWDEGLVGRSLVKIDVMNPAMLHQLVQQTDVKKSQARLEAYLNLEEFRALSLEDKQIKMEEIKGSIEDAVPIAKAFKERTLILMEQMLRE